MQRLGFDYSLGVESLAELPFNVCLFVSHFARADEPGHDSLARQMQRTMSLYTSLQSRHDTMRLSLCNSAGLLEGLGPEDLGRAGIALYGGNPYHDLPNPMQSVVGLQARVMQLRDVPPNTPVGYGGSFVTRRATRLAVLGVGYADGVPRLLSNNGAVILADRPCAIVGRVSMDLICVDVSEFSAEQVVEGDWAEVIGPRVSLDDVAVAAQTLAYEILTGLSTRVPRSYVEEPL